MDSPDADQLFRGNLALQRVPHLIGDGRIILADGAGNTLVMSFRFAWRLQSDGIHRLLRMRVADGPGAGTDFLAAQKRSNAGATPHDAFWFDPTIRTTRRIPLYEDAAAGLPVLRLKDFLQPDPDDYTAVLDGVADQDGDPCWQVTTMPRGGGVAIARTYWLDQKNLAEHAVVECNASRQIVRKIAVAQWWPVAGGMIVPVGRVVEEPGVGSCQLELSNLDATNPLPGHLFSSRDVGNPF